MYDTFQLMLLFHRQLKYMNASVVVNYLGKIFWGNSGKFLQLVKNSSRNKRPVQNHACLNPSHQSQNKIPSVVRFKANQVGSSFAQVNYGIRDRLDMKRWPMRSWIPRGLSRKRNILANVSWSFHATDKQLANHFGKTGMNAKAQIVTPTASSYEFSVSPAAWRLQLRSCILLAIEFLRCGTARQNRSTV